MPVQLDIFKSSENRDRGILQAVTHADQVSDAWSNRAFSFFTGWFRGGHENKTFMAEDIRKAAEGFVPDPPSQRAWGGIIRKASNAGLLERVGFRNTSNVKAHCTPASVWRFRTLI